MDKETYLSKLREKTEQLAAIHSDIAELKKQFIEDNKTFVIGDRVRIIKNGQPSENDEFGIIRGYKLNWSNNIEYDVYKIKKDGSASSVKHYIWSSDKLSLENIR